MGTSYLFNLAEPFFTPSRCPSLLCPACHPAIPRGTAGDTAAPIGRNEPARLFGASPGWSPASACHCSSAWTCSAVQSHSNSLPLFFYLLPQGATTERSDYPPIKSWQFAAISRDCDSQAARQFLRAGLPRLICSKSCKRHPGRQVRPDGWMYILGSRDGLSTLARGAARGGPDPYKGPAGLTRTLHTIDLFIHLQGWRCSWKKGNSHDGRKKSINTKGFLVRSQPTGWLWFYCSIFGRSFRFKDTVCWLRT